MVNTVPGNPPMVSTNDLSAASSHPTQQAGPDTAPLDADLSLQSGINSDEENTAYVEQTGPDAATCASYSALSQARDVFYGIPYLISFSMDHLWESYSLDYRLLAEVKTHLIETGLLTNTGEWRNIDGEKLDRKHFATQRKGVNEPFAFFPRLFNAVLGHLRRNGAPIREMFHTASEPKSNRVSNRRPDGFLHMATEAPPPPGTFRWRDLTCPFEYKLGDGETVNNGEKALLCLSHIMCSDPRRAFSFGSTVHGTKFRIWFLCRVSLFTFTPFDWFDDSESLLKFFIILATASETDLGFDANIKRVGESNFDLGFTVHGRTYHTSKLLCDIRANITTGRGTWVFKVNDQETGEVRVIKDCWLEDRPGGQMEHEVVAGIKTIMGDKEFRKYFIDIDGHRKTYESGRLNSVCEILENRTLENSEPDFVVHVPGAPQSSYHHRFQPDPVERVPNDLPHPRFRYQVVYNEAGISLFQVPSFADAIKHIGQAADGLHCLHQAGWVHRDFNPGNVIVVGGEAKISDLKFAKRRSANELKRLTRLGGVFSPGTTDNQTGTSRFMAVEVQHKYYLFRPEETGEDSEMQDNDDRIFLYNPLHDYESVWWVVAWFVFSSRPEGVTNDVMEKAQELLYKDRTVTFIAPAILRAACRLLPKGLEPLAEILVEMCYLLVDAYKSFEKSFDGSKMLDIFPKFREWLQLLVERAQGLVAMPCSFSPTLDAEEVFDAIALGWERGEEGEATDSDQSIGLQTGDDMLGKRTRVDSSSEIHRAAKRGKIEDEPTAES